MHLFHQYYLIKTEDNTSYFFYLNKNQEIHYNIYSAENLLLKNEKLVVEIVMDFAATIDFNNQIHVICITKSGVLNYYIGLDTKWKHKTLTQLDVKSNTYRYLSLLIDKNYTHIFCIKTNLLNATIASIEHMYWNQKNINKTTITTYMPGKYPSPYEIDLDSMGNIHIIYKVFYRSNHQLFYNKFNIFNKKWGTSEMVSDLQEEHSHPSILIDRRDNLHLVWCTITKNNFTLKYKNKMNITNPKSKWCNPKILSSTNANNLSPIILHEGSFIKVLSKQNNNINEVVSNDYGLSWEPSSRNQSYRSKNPILIGYFSNHKLENKSSKIKYVYGEIEDNVNIFGAKLFKVKESSRVMNITSNTSNTIHKEKDPHDDVSISNNIIKENIDSSLDIKDTKLESSENIQTAEIQTAGINKGLVANDMKEINRKDKSFDQLIYNIENHMNTLINELEKLLEIKNLLEKNSFNSEESNQSLTPTKSKEFFTNQLLEINNTLSILDKEKNNLKEKLNTLQNQFDIVESRIKECQNRHVVLQEELSKFTDENLGFVNKIMSFFR
ncbi:hypothetical protein SAMN05446037_100824 [Anaerovirgula multivorans]|uniref:BNR repeat-containing family member n=1 Tax=Anaerovirgula multivorans TaxID=312168 RepID=A0A239DND1_9FIRM|nr:hypothetical protein [Anaerovirgula multivorans]SNS33164.1 hypothetical protein SAMN05446037_100824 [Anaerovirgula multivorans]